MMLIIRDTRLGLRAKVGDILDIQTTTINGKFIMVPAEDGHCSECVLRKACDNGQKGFLCPNGAQPKIIEDLI